MSGVEWFGHQVGTVPPMLDVVCLVLLRYTAVPVCKLYICICITRLDACCTSPVLCLYQFCLRTVYTRREPVHVQYS